MQEPRIEFLGTGTAFHTDGRGAQSLLIRPGVEAPFLVDLGPTAPCAMARFEVDYAAIERLFVTHLHGDHTAGWPFLVLTLNFVSRRTAPFHVHGPEGVGACLDGLMRLCFGDVVEGGRLGFDIVYDELPVRAVRGLEGGRTAFEVLPMDHHATSLGYLFDVDGVSVGVTGDTRWCDNYEELARRSDVLITECTSVAGPVRAHLCLDQIRERSDRLERCRVVLVHLTDEVAADLAADPIPGVTAAHDGMTLVLK